MWPRSHLRHNVCVLWGPFKLGNRSMSRVLVWDPMGTGTTERFGVLCGWGKNCLFIDSCLSLSLITWFFMCSEVGNCGGATSTSFISEKANSLHLTSVYPATVTPSLFEMSKRQSISHKVSWIQVWSGSIVRFSGWWRTPDCRQQEAGKLPVIQNKWIMNWQSFFNQPCFLFI